MRIAVIGAGGTGGYFGGMLARAGEDVTFIARGAHLDAIRKNGLTVKSRLSGDFTSAAQATEDPNEIGPVDLVLFCVKTYDMQRALDLLPPLMGPDTIVLSPQNGVDNEDRIAQVVGEEHVLGSIAFIVTAISEPGVVAHTAGPGRITFGELAGGSSERAELLDQTFERAGIAHMRVDTIRATLWEKFIGICAYSGVTSLTRLPIGPIFATPETRALFLGTLREVDAIGRACGIDIPQNLAQEMFEGMEALANDQPWASSSMHHDLKEGRPLELESLNGTAVRLGREHGVPTPICSVIHAALKPYAAGAPTIPTPT